MCVYMTSIVFFSLTCLVFIHIEYCQYIFTKSYCDIKLKKQYFFFFFVIYSLNIPLQISIFFFFLLSIFQIYHNKCIIYCYTQSFSWMLTNIFFYLFCHQFNWMFNLFICYLKLQFILKIINYIYYNICIYNINFLFYLRRVIRYQLIYSGGGYLIYFTGNFSRIIWCTYE